MRLKPRNFFPPHPRWKHQAILSLNVLLTVGKMVILSLLVHSTQRQSVVQCRVVGESSRTFLPTDCLCWRTSFRRQLKAIWFLLPY